MSAHGLSSATGAAIVNPSPSINSAEPSIDGDDKADGRKSFFALDCTLRSRLAPDKRDGFRRCLSQSSDGGAAYHSGFMMAVVGVCVGTGEIEAEGFQVLKEVQVWSKWQSKRMVGSRSKERRLAKSRVRQGKMTSLAGLWAGRMGWAVGAPVTCKDLNL